MNFKHNLDFKPNYIVPNISSIVRCLSGGKGFSVIPDFLCREEIASGGLEPVWEGNHVLENTLYFGTRKRTMYEKEINMVKAIFEDQMACICLSETV